MADETLRLKWTRLVEWVLRSTDQIDCRALYPATIIKSDGNRATVKPDDERLGLQLSNKPIRRPDGFTAVPQPGMRCMIGWDGYREDCCFILLGFDGNGAVDSITLDSPIVTATKDLASQHELGKSAGTLIAFPNAPKVPAAVATGDDTAFSLAFGIANGQTLAPGDKIASVILGRAFAGTIRAVACAELWVFPAAAAAFRVVAGGTQILDIYYQGIIPIPGPLLGFQLTVFVRGSA